MALGLYAYVRARRWGRRTVSSSRSGQGSGRLHGFRLTPRGSRRFAYDERMTTRAPVLAADVVIVGGGNAGLAAALAAREAGASVLILEKAPIHLRGGNTYFTGGLFRFAYEGWDEIAQLIRDTSEQERDSVNVGAYPAAAFYDDVMRVTEGLADAELTDILVTESFPTMKWMSDRGARWVLAYGRQAFRENGVMRFWGGLTVEAVGGGKGLSDRLFELAERSGVEVVYDAKAVALDVGGDGAARGATVRDDEGTPDHRGPRGRARQRRIRGEPRDAHAVSRARLGPRQGPGRPLQHRRRHPHGPGCRRAALRPLERLSCGGVGPQRPALRRPQRRRPLPEAFLPPRADRQRRWGAIRR